MTDKTHEHSHPIAHFKTITKHRHKVMALCFRTGIGTQGLLHDLSKYSPSEFFSGAKYFRGNRSPNEYERELLGYSAAWMHHKGRNRHHYEYWTDVDPKTKRYAPVRMPLRYVTEMFCDRVAACKIYQGNKYTDASAYEYFIKGNAKDSMHPETAKKLCDWLMLLRDQGEKQAFAAIRSENKKNRQKKR